MIEPISRAILAETRSKLDDGAKLWACLDEWYVWIKPRHIPAAVELIANATRTINLELQPTKIQIWTASCNSPIPPAFQDRAKPTPDWTSSGPKIGPPCGPWLGLSVMLRQQLKHARRQRQNKLGPASATSPHLLEQGRRTSACSSTERSASPSHLRRRPGD